MMNVYLNNEENEKLIEFNVIGSKEDRIKTARELETHCDLFSDGTQDLIMTIITHLIT